MDEEFKDQARSRREFVKRAALSGLAVHAGASLKSTSFMSMTSLLSDSTIAEISGRGDMPSQDEVWSWVTWMAQLGPKFTGNSAHQTFVNFLETKLSSFGLQIEKDSYTFPRWDARRSAIKITPTTGQVFDVQVSSYFPYSGQTKTEGVSGQLAYGGAAGAWNLTDLAGKVVLIECPIKARPFAEWYTVWGVHPKGETPPTVTRPARGPVDDLTIFRKAGAVAVILGWVDISDANAADQYTPFSRPPQEIPGLYVGKETTARLRELAKTGASATVVLEAEITPDCPTSTIIATLPGSSLDDAIIVNTHTDGTNATEENGGVAIVALAKYFASLPVSQRKKTLVFPLTTGHFAGPWVPSIRGVIAKHPELIKKAVAAVTIEHLGCREWMDDAALEYKPTGKNELSIAISPLNTTADLMLDGLADSLDRTAVVNPSHGGWFGEGSALSRAGIPTIGYIPQPNYLLASPADGCIAKLSSDLMYSQIKMFAAIIRKMDAMSRSELRGGI
jgi:hypothetical protein